MKAKEYEISVVTESSKKLKTVKTVIAPRLDGRVSKEDRKNLYKKQKRVRPIKEIGKLPFNRFDEINKLEETICDLKSFLDAVKKKVEDSNLSPSEITDIKNLIYSCRFHILQNNNVFSFFDPF